VSVRSFPFRAGWVSIRDLAAIQERLRSLEWHPETTISKTPCPGRCDELDDLIAAKSRSVHTASTPQNARPTCMQRVTCGVEAAPGYLSIGGDGIVPAKIVSAKFVK